VASLHHLRPRAKTITIIPASLVVQFTSLPILLACCHNHSRAAELIDSSTPRSTPPKPSHSVPLRTSTPSPPPPSAPLALQRTLSPASIRSSSDRLPENYAGCSNSSSTTSLAQPSITVTPTKDSPRIQNRMTRNETPSTDWGWRKGSGSGDSSWTEARRPHLTSSVSSNSVASVSKKRSSGQLLSGLGRGLGRMGSVMRRNTSDGSSTLTPGGTEAA